MNDGERWVTPEGRVTVVDPEHIRGREITLELDTFHLLLEAAGYTRTDNLDPADLTP